MKVEGLKIALIADGKVVAERRRKSNPPVALPRGRHRGYKPAAKIPLELLNVPRLADGFRQPAEVAPGHVADPLAPVFPKGHLSIAESRGIELPRCIGGCRRPGGGAGGLHFAKMAVNEFEERSQLARVGPWPW